MPSNSSKIIIVLTAILLAVLVGSLVVLFAFPSVPNTAVDEVSQPQGTDAVQVSGEPSTASNDSGFQLRLLQTADYLSIDKKAIGEGTLPVTAPATVGKANPFL